MPDPHGPEGHLFIVTYGRSGSTLLQSLLNSIDGYCIRGENYAALMHLCRAWEVIADGEAMRGHRTDGAPTGPDHPWYGAELVDPEALGHALAGVFTREVLRPPPGTRIAGFKEIRFRVFRAQLERYVDFLTRFFPGARFIFNTRDHDAVARSGWWAQMPAEQVRRKLAGAEEGFARMRAVLDPARHITLHYDDYAGRPEALRPLFDWLGEPFDAARVGRVIERRLTHSGTPAQG